ncbi:MAG: DUF4440 domain-containing protein [Chthoniobacterales bacterium]
MSNDPKEALPLQGRNLGILVVGDHASALRVLVRLLDHFGMDIRSLFVCGALLFFAGVAYGAGSYQRTRDGKTLVWNDSPKRGEVATWSGKRDKNGFAVGSGTLTWYKFVPTIITGSLIPDTRRYAVVIDRDSGKMVKGKFKGVVTSVDANGKRLQTVFVNGVRRPVNGRPQNRRSPRKKATRAPTPAVTAIPTPEQTPASTLQQTATPTSERTPTPATLTPTPAPEQSPSPAAQETPTAVPQQAATFAPKRTATRTSKQQARQPDIQSTIVPMPTPPDDSLRSRTGPPLALPKPPPALDGQTVAELDTVYQAAVKDNDVAVMDRILADDFVLVTDRGVSLTKADLIKEAREKRTIYEHQEEEKGTQKVRIWRDTAVVTALLRIKGTTGQHPFDYKVWFTETYVRTATGWRYVFGQASIPLPEPDTK